ncbi:exonuclease domain-containing protein [Timonella sp. A28]|uniref:exonuclease domain-containing protein n=1 Tax=Timonella sp. A28 TaxID=3442640 RepID=UPI003EB7B246
MSLTFTAIDFETANASRASACSVGYTVVRNGRIVDTHHSFIFPPTGNEFTNTHIHGITFQDVIDAPAWSTAMEKMVDANPSAPFIAYSHFDKGVWNAAWALDENPEPPSQFLDALVLVKHHLSLAQYKLPLVTQHLGLPEFDHHNAAADSLACAQIVLSLSNTKSAATLDELWPNKAVTNNARYWAGKKTPTKPTPNPDANPNHPLFGQVICFTGSLPSMERAEAFAACAAVGAIVVTGVTLKTTLVVQGDYVPGVLTGPLSSKARKALDMADAGKPIRLIGEAEFLSLLH